MYTRSGTYEGTEASSSGWILVHKQDGIQGKGLAQIEMLDEFATSVLIPAGSTQAFRLVANKRILYGRVASAPQIAVADTAALSLKSGKMTSDSGTFVQTSDASYEWNGFMQYCQLSQPASNTLQPTVTPISLNFTYVTLSSAFFGITSVHGKTCASHGFF